MVLQHIGSMPHELTKDSIGPLSAPRSCRSCGDIWDDEGWENHWWPKSLRNQRLALRGERHHGLRRDPRIVEVWDGAGSARRCSFGGQGPPLLYLPRRARPCSGTRFLDSPGPGTTRSTRPYLAGGRSPATPDAHKAPRGRVGPDALLRRDPRRPRPSLRTGGRRPLLRRDARRRTGRHPARSGSRSWSSCVPSACGPTGRPVQEPQPPEASRSWGAGGPSPTPPARWPPWPSPSPRIRRPWARPLIAISLGPWGVSTKFWWPIPDRGLDKRIHRITAPTLVVWGAQGRDHLPRLRRRLRPA